MGQIKIKRPTDSVWNTFRVQEQGDSMAWSRRNADPFAARVNSSSEYDEIDIWNEWFQNDWQDGVGQTGSESNGFVYGEMDSRVPRRLIPAAKVRFLPSGDPTFGVESEMNYPDQNIIPITLGEVGTPWENGVAFCTKKPHDGCDWDMRNTIRFWVLVLDNGDYSPDDDWDQSLRVELRSSSGSYPGWPYGSSSYWAYKRVVKHDFPGPYWLEFEFVANTFGMHPINNWICIKPAWNYDTNSPKKIVLGGFTDPASLGMNYMCAARYSSFSKQEDYGLMFLHDLEGPTGAIGVSYGTALWRQNQNLYMMQDRVVWKLTNHSGEDSWQEVASSASRTWYCTGAWTWAGNVYFGRDLSSPSDEGVWMDKDENLYYTQVHWGQTYCKHGPFLYRAQNSEVWYTMDGIAWEGPVQVGSGEYPITGMAGMGQNIYCATAEALYVIYPGDVVDGVTAFGSIDDNNGTSMILFENAIYMVVNGRVMRLTEDHRLLDVWFTREDDLLQSRIGAVFSLTVMNNWMVAYLSSERGGSNTAWAYQSGAWHHLFTLPPGNTSAFGVFFDYQAYYDRATQRIYFTTPYKVTADIYVPDYSLNPVNDPAARFSVANWVEWDRNWGGQVFINKDWESISMQIDHDEGANFAVDWYWRTENNADWQYLGSITQDNQELRFDNYENRPHSRWIELGMSVCLFDLRHPPEIRAIVVKYLPIVTDRIQDTITVDLAPIVQQYNPALKHIQTGLFEEVWYYITSQGPLLYEDPFGQQFEVTCVDYAVDDIRTHPGQNGETVVNQVRANLVLRQVPNQPFTGLQAQKTKAAVWPKAIEANEPVVQAARADIPNATY